MTIIEIVNIKLAVLTLIGKIFIISSILYLIFFRKKYGFISKFIGKYGILFAFITALIATSGSLFYSNYAGFTPCVLCWFQRIFMYPLVIVLGMTLFKKRADIIDHALSLSTVGFLISLYHNYIYYKNQGLIVPCDALSSGVSCVKRYVFEFGYITIPMMALTAFVIIIIFLIFAKVNQKIENSK